MSETEKPDNKYRVSGSELSDLVMCDDGRLAPVPRPPWATHAMGGFKDSDDCIDHADENSPGVNYGISFHQRPDGVFIWQWFYPEYEHQRRN